MTPPRDAAFLSIGQAAAAIAAGRLTPAELVDSVLARISALEPATNAFIAVRAESARAEAQAATLAIRQGGPIGPLHGIPIAVKDMFATHERPATFGSPHFRDGAGPDAAVIERLGAAGAVIVGWTNLDEFAFGSFSANPHYGQVRNPWDRARTPGGSSGGSAAAVAAGFALAALGSDTGVSIRQPASLCNLVGLKPTYGLISRFGAMPFSGSLDHVGPLTRTVGDAAILLAALAGHDPRDPGSAGPDRRESYAARPHLRGVKIGVPAGFLFEGCEAGTEKVVRAAIQTFRSLGAELCPIDLPHMEELNRLSAILCRAEAAAIHRECFAARPETFGGSMQGFLRAGLAIPASVYRDALERRDTVVAEVEPILSQVDAVVTPTTPLPATLIADGPERDEMLRWRYTGPFTILGLPALSVPCGFTENGLPIGMQMVGRRFGDIDLLSIAGAYEKATDWHQRRPNLS